MKTIMDFIKNQKAMGYSLIAVAVIMLGAMALSGCSLGDIIKHGVPEGMQEFNGGEPKVSLNTAPYVMEKYVSSVEINMRQFVEENEKAHLIFDFINSLATVGLQEIGNSPIPGATIISGLLLGFGGLMTRKPGTAKEMAEEKMSSFNKGQASAFAQLQEVKSLITPEKMAELLAAIKAKV